MVEDREILRRLIKKLGRRARSLNVDKRRSFRGEVSRCSSARHRRGTSSKQKVDAGGGERGVQGEGETCLIEDYMTRDDNSPSREIKETIAFV